MNDITRSLAIRVPQLWASLLRMLDATQKLPKVLRAVRTRVDEGLAAHVDTLIGLAEDQIRDAAADRERAQVMAELELVLGSAWAGICSPGDPATAIPSQPGAHRWTAIMDTRLRQDCLQGAKN